jgi:ABC-2 type transport system permease protein
MIGITLVNMAIGTAVLRDEGVLKRVQGTPLPRWAYVTARIASTVVIVAAMTVVTLTIGAVAYGVQVRAATLPGLILTMVVGTAVFTTLGMGVTRFIPNAEAAPVVVNLIVMPLTFISGVFFPTASMPHVLNDVAKLFPIEALANGLQFAFNPHTAGAGFNGSDLGTLAIWTVAGVVLMLKFLRQPQGEVA